MTKRSSKPAARASGPPVPATLRTKSASPRPRGVGAWTQTDKRNWHAEWWDDPRGAHVWMSTVPGEPARTRYFVYLGTATHNMGRRYLGSTPDLESAKRKAEKMEFSLRDPGRLPSWAPAPTKKFVEDWEAQRAADETASKTKTLKLPTRVANPVMAEAAAAKPARVAAPRAFDAEATIVLTTSANPRKAGTVQAQRFDVILAFNGKKFSEFVAGGGDATALKYAVQTGHVKMEER